MGEIYKLVYTITRLSIFYVASLTLTTLNLCRNNASEHHNLKYLKAFYCLPFSLSLSLSLCLSVSLPVFLSLSLSLSLSLFLYLSPACRGGFPTAKWFTWVRGKWISGFVLLRTAWISASFSITLPPPCPLSLWPSGYPMELNPQLISRKTSR